MLTSCDRVNVFGERCKVAIWGFAETCSEGEFEEQCDLDTTRIMGVRLRPTR